MLTTLLQKIIGNLAITAIFAVFFVSPEQAKAKFLDNNVRYYYTYPLTQDKLNVDNTIEDMNLWATDKPKPIEPPDSDSDGIPDSKDLCPNIPGSVKAQGCPDADDDGIPDFLDDCPNLAGLPEFNGCPDTDGDGVPDNKDNCPTIAGPKRNMGCPVIETIANDEPEPDSATRVTTIAPRRDIFEEDPPIEVEVEPTETYYYEADHNNPKPVVKAEPEVAANTTKKPTEAEEKLANTKPANTHKMWKTSQRDIILSNDEIKLIDDVLTGLTFMSGRITIDNNSYALLDRFAELLNKKYSWVVILHCYTNEADNAYRNQQLSYNRGSHIRSQLTKRGVSASRIQIKGMGDSIIAPDDMPANRIELEITR